MNPPIPPPPLPFAELLKLATAGPWSHSWAYDSGTIFGQGLPVAKVLRGNRSGDEKNANAELVVRLLNWAHAGGVEELREAYDTVKMVSYGLSAHRGKADRLRHSLALLDGQREKP